MDNIALEEKELYERMWNGWYKGRPSPCAVPLVDLVDSHVNADDVLLEIGCGDRTTISRLIDIGHTAVGCDIVKQHDDTIEACAWDLPFEDNQFDVTYSTDVFEHFPTSKVEDAIRETLRVTSRKSIHVIATFKAQHHEATLHKTVRHIEWWREQFHRLNDKNIELAIIDTNVILGIK